MYQRIQGVHDTVSLSVQLWAIGSDGDIFHEAARRLAYVYGDKMLHVEILSVQSKCKHVLLYKMCLFIEIVQIISTDEGVVARIVKICVKFCKYVYVYMWLHW